jgi:hypothetical protein
MVPVEAPVMLPEQVKLPLELVTVQPVEPEPPPRSMSPVLVPPSKTWPVVLPSSEIFCAAPPAAIAMELEPVKLPMATRLPLLSMRWVPAPAPVLMPVVPFRVVPVTVEALVIVPEPLVEILPEVVIASPAVAGCRVVPLRLQ